MGDKEIKLTNAVRVGRGLFILLNKDGCNEIASKELSGHWYKGRTPNPRFNDFPLLVSLSFEDNSEVIEVGMGMPDYVHFDIVNSTEYRKDIENQLQVLNKYFK